MPKDACWKCRERKVRCRRNPGDSVCLPCARHQYLCTYSDPTATAENGTRIRSCQRCRIKRMKCERQGEGCVACTASGDACSFATPRERSEASTSSTAGQEAVHDQSATPTVAEAHMPSSSTSGNALAIDTTPASESGSELDTVSAAVHGQIDNNPSSSLTHGALTIDTAPSSSSARTVSTAPTSPNRIWWDVCFAPSPQESES
ncbi:hypothetical protein PYCCODRAFT_1435159 [Trametes coccinea BRFM310]|uniref:Zn(2)-C6 fungal-type domain-containing protein n=1 Tax=Trametes coccinea (strain BRFM310) TaxID=1353009 RepID=A0A1Y2IRM6_TRAC3|nr:hypothetical protein PYCCODRAFT_1435159 [Trametes coccinea BRFM310]